MNKGQNIGHYTIIRQLGKGGMGEVYLAEDTKLKREVAIKVLPEEVRQAPERLKRFRREAEAAAKLNHPNIATIHSIEESDEQVFITMEYVDGRPLSDHIPTNGLSIEQFFDWFIPLSDALAHAHDQGRIHRDLKPGNIMIRKDGTPKILDFGLARIIRPDPISVTMDSQVLTQTLDLQESSVPLTKKSQIVGTPAYMSPEQIQGQTVDFRTDLFSFGALMYETLSSKRPFKHQSLNILLMLILTVEPEPLTKNRPMMPYTLWSVVRKCLMKDRDQRMQTARELCTELEHVQQDIQSGTLMVDAKTLLPQKPVPFWRQPAVIGAVGVALIIGITIAWHLKPLPTAPLRKSQFTVYGELDFSEYPVISPNGSKIAYISDGKIFIRELNRINAREFPNTDGARRLFWSPNSEYLGYFSEDMIKRVPAIGGQSQTLFNIKNGGEGATWGSEGDIVVTDGGLQGLLSASEWGGELSSLVKPDPSKGEEDFHTPFFLPDGRNLLFVIHKINSTSDEIVIQLGDSRRTIVHHPDEWIDFPVYSPSGHILYTRLSEGKSSIWAIPFSLESLDVTGIPFPVAQNAAAPNISIDGTLVYRSWPNIEGLHRMLWVDRTGRIIESIGQSQKMIGHPSLAPEGNRVTVAGGDGTGSDIWIHDIVRTTTTRLTSNPTSYAEPTWSYDGDQVVFTRLGGDIFTAASNGSGSIHLLIKEGQNPNLSKDGKYIVYHTTINPNTNNTRDLWYLPLRDNREPKPFLQTNFEEGFPVFSPDSRYIAYMSDESGQFEIYVQRFPERGEKVQVSTKGGVYPRWNGRGDELFYVEDNNLMSVTIDTQSSFQSSIPKTLFKGEEVGLTLYDGGGFNPSYDVHPNGQRFVVVQKADEPTQGTITIVQNWYTEFEEK